MSQSVSSSCAICMETIKETNACVTPCAHSFCLTCILVWSKRSPGCPVCRQRILPAEEAPPAAADRYSMEDDGLRFVLEDLQQVYLPDLHLQIHTESISQLIRPRPDRPDRGRNTYMSLSNPFLHLAR